MNTLSYKYHEFPNPKFPVDLRYEHLPEDSSEQFNHWHIDIEFFYIIFGSATITLNSNKIHAEAGDIVIVNSNYFHNIETSKGEDCTYYRLIIKSEHCEDLGFDTTYNVFEPKTTSYEIKNIYNLIIKEMTNQKKHHKMATVALCTTLLILLYRHLRQKNKSREIHADQTLEMVTEGIKYIYKNYQNKMTVDDICQSIGVSKYYFSRIFKNITGNTIIEFTNILRLRKANYLMSELNYSINDTARECGFSSASYFSKSYKKHFGYSPSSKKLEIN